MAPGDQRRGSGQRAPAAAKPGRRPRALRVTTVDRAGRPLREIALRRWLERVAPASARGTVTIALVSDAHVRALNRAYRHKDYATDVLSFPAVENSGPRTNRRTRSADGVANHFSASSASSAVERFLGDIVIATGVARRQAREAGHTLADELRLLALHGLLHLLGYDHERDRGEMARVERRLRRRGGLRAGLIERAGPSARATA